jgi:chorismate mutase/prephenate dehydrogenase
MSTDALPSPAPDGAVSAGPSAPRPLPLLRAMIDALDRDLLQIVARRMALVAEVAAYKRAHGLRVRDAERERALLADRARRAEALGLPAAEIESMFRVLLRASRDHQSALGAEAPPDPRPRTVAVVGGRGGIGRVVVRLFEDLGHRVLVADLDTELTGPDAAAAADVTVVSVPIDATERVVREVGPRVRPDALLMDVTSVKGAPVAAMLEATARAGAGVVGAHPMFGPGVHTLQGQRVVLCRGRGDGWYDWAAGSLAARGLVVTEATPEAHDRAMAVVQVLTHFQTQVYGLALARLERALGLTLAETLGFTSPAYLLELFVAARHFAQSPGLYGPIEMRNPRAGEVTAAFRAAADEVAAVIGAGDRAGFEALFDEVRAFFGAFTAEAVEQSGYLIDRIVERS